MIEINPLNVLGVRKINYVAPHFAKVKINEFEYQNIESWIQKKCKGRYFISKKIPNIVDNLLKLQSYVGFEDHSELSYFLLTCPFIRRN